MIVLKIFILCFAVVYSAHTNAVSPCDGYTKCLCSSSAVNCTGAGLTSLPPTINAGKLYYYFEENQLKTLNKNTFRHFNKAKHINAGKNRISHLGPKTFNHNKLLSQLYLDHNRITSLPATLFTNNHNLTLFSANFNNITSIGSGLFKNCPLLSYISITNNQLTAIAPDAFTTNLALSRLLLEVNHLTTPMWQWIDHLKHSETFEIYLDRNPWICDCRMRQFKTEVETHSWYKRAETPKRGKKGIASHVKCSAPPNHASMNIEAVDSLSLTCESPTILTNTSVLLAEGKPGVVTCSATGIPLPQVWFADETGRNVTHPHPGVGNMTFNSVLTDEAGLYSCFASGWNSSAIWTLKSTPVTVIVKSKPAAGLIITLAFMLPALVIVGIVVFIRQRHKRRDGYGSLTNESGASARYDHLNDTDVTSATLLRDSSDDEMDEVVSYAKDNTDEREVLV
ncbi:uncharacterized protein LOC100179296 [Ciona intestinalis]